MPKPTTPKPCRCYAIVTEKGRVVAVWKPKPLKGWLTFRERLIRGRFVPDAPKGRKQ
jgi:hypothetical protein